MEINDWQEVAPINDWQEVAPSSEIKYQPDRTSLKEQFLGVPEAVLNVASGIPAWAIGKVAGETTAALNVGNKDWGTKSKKVRDTVQDILTYKPMTTTGKELGEAAGTIISAPFKAAAYPLTKAGEYATEKGHPNLGYVLEDAGDTLSAVIAPKITNKLGTIGEKIPEIAKKRFNEVVDYGMNKGVKPSSTGRGTYSQNVKKTETGRDLVKSIIENKQNIKLIDPETGAELPAGSLPTSKKYATIQMSQAVEQGKRNIWEQIDDMKKSATGKGIEVDYSPVVDMLNSKLKNDQSLQGRPNALNYAKQQLEYFENLTDNSLDFNGKEITDRNANLKAFSKNPQYGQINSVLINNEIVTLLREIQDKAVTKTEGKGYSDLQKKYGSFLDHEKEINNRAVASARSNPKGLIDFGDIPIYGELISAGLTGNVAGAIKAGAWKTVQQYIKMKNNPNYIIADMFKQADKNLGYYSKEYGEWHLPEYTEERPNMGVEAPSRQAPPQEQRPSYGMSLLKPGEPNAKSGQGTDLKQWGIFNEKLMSEISKEVGEVIPSKADKGRTTKRDSSGGILTKLAEAKTKVPAKELTAQERQDLKLEKDKKEAIKDRSRMTELNKRLKRR